MLCDLDAEIIALQEMFSLHDARLEHHQVAFIAGQLGLHHCFGGNCKRKGRSYGNALLSRFPMRQSFNHNISAPGREPRGCLRADISLPGGVWLHVFNVHLGTAFLERRKQARWLLSPEVLNGAGLQGPRIVLGDFNEWTKGLTTRLLRAQFVKPLAPNRVAEKPLFYWGFGAPGETRTPDPLLRRQETHST